MNIVVFPANGLLDKRLGDGLAVHAYGVVVDNLNHRRRFMSTEFNSKARTYIIHNSLRQFWTTVARRKQAVWRRYTRSVEHAQHGAAVPQHFLQM